MKIHILFLTACIVPFFSFAQNDADTSGAGWSGSASVYGYIIPGDKEPPTISGYVDHNKLHLETRFNYEDINSASVFAGYNYEHDGKASVTLTPMIGFVGGRTNGILPGLEFNIDYKFLNLYSENEYMLDFKGEENYFFYSWTQLSAETIKNLKLGFAAQSLRWFKTKFDIQRGPYAEYAIGNFSLDVYYYNPLTSSQFFIVSATVNF